jgi:hypothetical protein
MLQGGIVAHKKEIMWERLRAGTAERGNEKGQCSAASLAFLARRIKKDREICGDPLEFHEWGILVHGHCAVALPALAAD